MTATNHAVTGALIGIVMANPLAIPVAFISHFLLDALPHFGYPGTTLHSRTIKHVLVLDAAVLSIVSLVLIFTVINPLLVLVCMLAAILPDIISAQRYIREVRTGERETENLHLFGKFHSNIQWCERSWGWIPELVWFAMILFILGNIL
jgi:hypothetical protein